MKNHNYHGNRKPYAAVLCHSSDSAKLEDIFKALEARGLMLCVIDEKRGAGSIISKACGVISVFSESFNSSETLQSLFLSADSAGKTIVPLRADDSALPELFTRLAYTNNSINLSKYSPEEAADRIMTAPCFNPPGVTREQTGAYKRTAAALVAAALAVAAFVGVPLIKNYLSEKAEQERLQAAYEDIESRFGLTAEELAEIKCFCLIGNSLEKDTNEFSDRWAYVYEDWEGDECSWRRNDDGSEVEEGTTDDFSFLTMLPNLRRIILINQSAAELPDLSSLDCLQSVELIDCGFDSLEGLKGCKALNTLEFSLDKVTDLSPLAECPKLNTLNINQSDSLTTLNGLDSLTALRSLSLWCSKLKDISALSSMEKLSYLCIGCNEIRDYSPISSCRLLQELQLENYSETIDLSFLASLSELRHFICRCEGCTNLDGLSRSMQLSTFQLDFTGDTRRVDLSFLKGLSLSQIELNNVRTDFEFLSEGQKLSTLNLCGNGYDFSGIERLGRIQDVVLNLWNNNADSFLSAVSSADIKTVSLYHCGDTDLSLVPETVTSLTLENCDNVSIEGLNCPKLTMLKLNSMNRLSSLTGIQCLESLKELHIVSCVRLNDWSALYERGVKQLYLGKQYSLPDFAQLSFEDAGKLSLDSIPGLTELNCLDGLKDDYAKSHQFILSVKGNELIDLQALERFTARKLTVSPSLEKQAAELVEKGCFSMYYIEESEYDSESSYEDFTLESLDELYSLPDYLLERLKRLYIGGDQVFDDGWFGWNGDPGENCLYTFSSNNDGGNEIEITSGSIKDFSMLSKLTGLEELVLVNQPLESVDGIQYLSGLKRLELVGCDIEDISPVFALSSLEQLRLEDCRRLGSIAGIQNLFRLHELNVTGSHITDFSPLSKLNPNAYKDCGFCLSIMAYQEECMPEEFSFLSAINYYSHLELHGCPGDEFAGYLDNCDIDDLYLFNCFENQNTFQELMGSLGSLKRLTISWNQSIADLSCILNMDGLEYLRVSYDMEDAINSLKGRDYSFELEIEG